MNTTNVYIILLAAALLPACKPQSQQSALTVDCTEALNAMASFYSYSTVDWCELDERYYRPYNADWPEDYETRFSPEFPGELIAPYWHRLQNARTFFHQQTLPLRAVAPAKAIRQLDRTEALFDTLFVRTVSQQYYLRLYVDAYEELMPREIDKCFLSLNN